jgi:hypothetical protein
VWALEAGRWLGAERERHHAAFRVYRHTSHAHALRAEHNGLVYLERADLVNGLPVECGGLDVMAGDSGEVLHDCGV